MLTFVKHSIQSLPTLQIIKYPTQLLPYIRIEKANQYQAHIAA